jgi:hypothetical protein
MFGVTVPENRMAVAPPPDLPIEAYVIVFEPAVAAGKLMIAFGDTLLAVLVQPPEVRAVLCLA